MASSDERRASPNAPRDAGPGLALTVSPARVATTLGIVAVIVIVLGIVANRLVFGVAPDIEAPLARAAARFDLALEPSVLSMYSTLLLSACAGMLAVHAMSTPRKSPTRGGWWFLAVVFTVLAVDETAMIHEMANDTLREVLGTSGVLYFAWVIPGLLFTLAVGLVSLRLLMRLDSRSRDLFLISGVVFLSGAVGMELVAGPIVSAGGGEELEGLAIMFQEVFEGILEMGGSILFLYALLDRFGRLVGTARIAVEPGGR